MSQTDQGSSTSEELPCCSMCGQRLPDKFRALGTVIAIPELSPSERVIVRTLAEASGKFVPTGKLIDKVWHPNREPADPDATLRILIYRARRMLWEYDWGISCVSKVGYALVPKELETYPRRKRNHDLRCI